MTLTRILYEIDEFYQRLKDNSYSELLDLKGKINFSTVAIREIKLIVIFNSYKNEYPPYSMIQLYETCNLTFHS